MNYGAYLTTDKLIAIELPAGETDSSVRNRKMRRARADMLAKNLRHHTDPGSMKPDERWVMEKAIEVLVRQSK